ncbi:MAG: DNA polymerase [Rhodanobacter sp.]
MSTVRCYLATEDPINPTAMEILQRVKDEVIGSTYNLEFAPAHDAMPPRATIFALGKYRAYDPSHRVVPAPSVAQIQSHSGIVTRLGQAFQLLVQPPDLPEFAYEVLDGTRADLFLSRRTTLVAYDLEWSGDNDEPDYARVISAAFYDGARAYVIPEDVLQSPHIYRRLCNFLEGNAVVTVNGKGDLSYTPDAKVDNHFDCMLAHFVLWPTLEHGLKPVTKMMFGFDDWDEATKSYRKGATYDSYERFEDGSWHDARTYSNGSGFERIPRAMLYEYNGYDVYATYWWFVRMREMLAADPDAMKAFKKRMRLSALFQAMEARKFHIDVPYLKELREELEEEWEHTLEKFYGIAGGALNPNSPAQVKAWFVANDRELPKQKVSSGPKKGTMQVSSNEGSMNEVLASSGYSWRSKEFAKTLLELRGITKMRGTYIDGYLAVADERGGIRPNFNLAGPITGRLANRGPGVMTIPRDERLRRMVIPSAHGRVLVKPDYGQLEMRIVAAESGDERYIAAFQPGMPDFFVSLMPMVFPDVDFSGLTPAQMKKHPLRNKIKPFSHGLNYGRSAAAIAAEHGMSMAEANRIANNYLGPEDSGIRLWQAELKRKALAGEPIVTPYGFHLQSELVTDKNKSSVENQALAFPGQSIGNDMCLEAALRIAPRIEPLGAWLVATIHDQIIADSPIETASRVGAIMQEEMEQEGRNVYGDLLVFEAEAEFGFTWSEKMDPKQWEQWLYQNGYASRVA